jgi:hypothetical protein
MIVSNSPIIILAISFIIASIIFVVIYLSLSGLFSIRNRKKENKANNKELIIEVIQKAMSNVELYSKEDLKELEKTLILAYKFFKIRTDVRHRARRTHGKNPVR